MTAQAEETEERKKRASVKNDEKYVDREEKRPLDSHVLASMTMINGRCIRQKKNKTKKTNEIYLINDKIFIPITFIFRESDTKRIHRCLFA